MARAVCEEIGAEVGWSSPLPYGPDQGWRSAYCTGSMDAGSTIVTVNVHAVGDTTVSQIETIASARFATAAQLTALVSGLGGAYTSLVVISINSTIFTYVPPPPPWELSAGAIAGIVVGTLVGAALISSATFFKLRRHQTTHSVVSRAHAAARKSAKKKYIVAPAPLSSPCASKPTSKPKQQEQHRVDKGQQDRARGPQLPAGRAPTKCAPARNAWEAASRRGAPSTTSTWRTAPQPVTNTAVVAVS
jgi:hypothetical protein